MKAPAFDLIRARSLEEAHDALAAHGDDAVLLAGGQSLVPTLDMRLSAPAMLVDINFVPELEGIEAHDDVLRIGALTRHHALGSDALVARHAPLLTEAVPHIAHAAVRSRGTLGGSLAHADPAAELPACALALGATLVLASSEHERRVAAEEFFGGLFETELCVGEVLRAVEVPVARPGDRSALIELTRRHGDYALAGVAARASFDEGRLATLRLAYFGVADRPLLARRAAAAACAEDSLSRAADAACETLTEDLETTGDLYHGAATKLHLARVMTRRVLGALAGDAAPG